MNRWKTEEPVSIDTRPRFHTSLHTHERIMKEFKPEVIREYMKYNNELNSRKVDEILPVVFDAYMDTLISYASKDQYEFPISIFGNTIQNLEDNKVFPRDLRSNVFLAVVKKFRELGFKVTETVNDVSGKGRYIISWARPWWKFWSN